MPSADLMTSKNQEYFNENLKFISPELQKVLAEITPELLDIEFNFNNLQANQNPLVIFRENISNPARKADEFTNNILKATVTENDLSALQSNCIFFYNCYCSNESLLEYLNNKNPIFTNQLNKVIYVYSNIHLPFFVLKSCSLSKYLKMGSIEFWPLDQSENLFQEIRKNTRNPLWDMRFIGDDTSHLLKITQKCKTQSAIEFNKAELDIKKYYSSPEFQKRLQSIKTGLEKPRIQVMQACKTRAVKNFSRNIAKSLINQAYTVFIHPNCDFFQTDYQVSDYLEVAKFKPDIIIYSPNWGPHKIPGLELIPSICSFQDSCNLSEMTRFVNESIYKDTKYMIVNHWKQYEESVIKGGIPKENTYFQQDLGKDLSQELPETQIPKDIDVGLVKSIPKRLDLVNFIFRTPQALKNVDHELRHLILGLEEKILSFIENESVPPPEFDLLNLVSEEWGRLLPAFYNNRLIIHFLEQLAPKNIKLALFGDNWNQHENYAPFDMGFIANDQDYQNAIQRIKINISINPFTEIHPRVFEAGRLGAFFLIYKVSDKNTLMPKELKPGVHFDYFENRQSLHEKVDYYLTENEKREEIAQNFKESLKEHFNYETISKNMIEHFIKKII